MGGCSSVVECGKEVAGPQPSVPGVPSRTHPQSVGLAAALAGTAPLNSSWLPLEVIVLTAPGGGAGFSVTRPKGRPWIGFDHAHGGKEVCIHLGLGLSAHLITS